MNQILLVLLSVFFGSAWAVDPKDKDILRHETKEAAMRADGFDIYDAARNREFNELIMLNNDKLINYLGSVYAGGWVDYGDDRKIRQVIAITQKVKIDSLIFPDDYYRFVHVKYSIDDLGLVRSKVDEMFLGWYGAGFLKTIGINVKRNKVELSVSSENYQRAHEGLIQSGLNLDMLEIKVMDAEIRPLSNHYPKTKLMLQVASVSG